MLPVCSTEARERAPEIVIEKKVAEWARRWMMADPDRRRVLPKDLGTLIPLEIDKNVGMRDLAMAEREVGTHAAVLRFGLATGATQTEIEKTDCCTMSDVEREV